MTLKRTAVLVTMLVISGHSVVIAQDVVSHARELYLAANYEEALNALDAIETDAHAVSQRQAVREYRVLCLIALQRFEDAVRTIQQMIDADPFYRPAERQPPRLITLFDQVRRQRLPELARMRYVAGTTAFDEYRQSAAIENFTLALRLVEEAEAGSRGEQAEWELSSLRRFATRFLEVVRTGDQQTQGVKQAVRDTFDKTDADVAPPISVRQDIPSWQAPTGGSAPLEGELEVIIDVAGTVREARLTTPIHPTYDLLLIDSARKWTYRPAIKNGRPVTYRKVITISLMTPPRISAGQ